MRARAGEDQAARPTSRPPPTHRAAAPERVCGTDHAPSGPGGRASKTSRISRILPPPQRLGWPIAGGASRPVQGVLGVAPIDVTTTTPLTRSSPNASE